MSTVSTVTEMFSLGALEKVTFSGSSRIGLRNRLHFFGLALNLRKCILMTTSPVITQPNLAQSHMSTLRHPPLASRCWEFQWAVPILFKASWRALLKRFKVSASELCFLNILRRHCCFYACAVARAKFCTCLRFCRGEPQPRC